MTDQTHCREAFEKWIRTCDGHPFAGQFANLMWKAWQACWNTRAQASAPEGEDAMAVRYFAADPSEGEFDTFATIDEAKAKARQLLEWAGDAAYEDGWADEPPQICYGIVIAGCEEELGSRKPAPEGSDFTEMVSFRLAEPTYTRSNAKAGEVEKDSARYAYLLEGEVIAARPYLPNIDAEEFKAKLRAKHDRAIATQRGDDIADAEGRHD